MSSENCPHRVQPLFMAIIPQWGWFFEGMIPAFPLFMQAVALFLVSILFSWVAFAGPQCADLFFSAPHFSSHHLEQTQSSKTLLGDEALIIKRRSTVQTKLFLKKETFAEWADFKTNPDKPGDIRWGALYLPGPLKKLLGLETLSASGSKTDVGSTDIFYVQVPHVQTVIKVFQKIESEMRLQDPHLSLVNFYETRNEIFSEKEYLQNFAVKSRLPFSSQGHLFEHDLNFHAYSSLVLPPVMTRALRLRVQSFLDFLSRAEKNPAFKKADIEKLQTEVLHEVVQRVDISTGNLFGSVVRLPGKDLNLIMTEVYDVLDLAFMGERTTAGFLHKLLERYDLGVMQNSLQTFLQEPSRANLLEPDLSADFLQNPSELYNDARSQFKKIKEVSEGILLKAGRGPSSVRSPQGKLILDKSGYAYDPEDRSCDGFPRLQVETMPGTCLGMVLPRDRALDADTQKGFIKPRTILPLKNSREFLVVDMGGWSPRNGRLFLLRPSVKGPYEIKLLKSGLETPHGLRYGPDGMIYVGERTKISRFSFVKGEIQKWQTVVGSFLRPEGYMHPLSQFAFDPRNGDLYLNAGSPSDHCVVQGTGAYKSCPEEETQGQGAIYRFSAERLKNLPPQGLITYEVAAQGLRNSMAMVVSPQGFLIQGENSRDFPELNEPYEEINVIDLDHGRGLHYGWPYCYNFHATAPEWLFPENKNLEFHKRFTKPVDCNLASPQAPGDYAAPWLLMPPHVAPLHMDYYRGSMFAAELAGKLLVTWHGYQPTGQRLVAYDVDEKGRPLAKAQSSRFAVNQKGACPAIENFSPQGGLDRQGSYQEVISGWGEVKGVRPKGAPVAFTEASDGSLWIVEDRENRTVIRLARTPEASYSDQCEKKSGTSLDPAIEALAWRDAVKDEATLLKGYRSLQENLIQKYCLGCHGNMQSGETRPDVFSNLDFIFKNSWISPGEPERSKLFGSIAHLEGMTPMPPIDKPQFFGTREGETLIKSVGDWIHNLPRDVSSRLQKVKITAKRNVRAGPGTSAGVCGQLQTGDTVVIDSRPEKAVTQDAYKWVRVFLVPSHSRLFKDRCPPPLNGVYYIAF